MLEISKDMQARDDAPAVPIFIGIFLDCAGLLPVWILRIAYNKHMTTMFMTSLPGPAKQLDLIETSRLVDIIPSLGHPAGHLGTWNSM